MYKNPFVKKFLFIYAIAVVLVLLYFLLKTLFLEEKEITYKSFHEANGSETISDVQEKREEEKIHFIVLPKK